MTYKIFFEDQKIILTNKLKKSYKKKYPIYTKEKISIPDFLKKIENHSSGKFIFFIEDKKERLLDEFARELTKVAAAGGVVRNDEGKILFIKRKGKWDLPKGKLERGEDLKKCAQREVEEETGLDTLSLLGLRSTTYHIYKRDNKYHLKETFWYNMYSDSSKELIPQEEEDIESCTWEKPKKLKKILKNSFASIRTLFKNEY